MKQFFLSILTCVMITNTLSGQDLAITDQQEKAINTLIDQYAQARETKDSVLLKRILSPDVDQLVSTGVWRRGLETSMKGMLRSSARNPGERTITIDNLRLVSPETAIVDCRYEIQQSDGSIRKMWSTFIMVSQHGKWQITAIRNMLPRN